MGQHTWRYVACRQVDGNGDEAWDVRELYGSEVNEAPAYTASSARPFGESLAQLRRDLTRMYDDVLRPDLAVLDLGKEQPDIISQTELAAEPERRVVRKVVGYVVHDGRLLVFAHDGIPLEVAGIQVPAGTIEAAEQAEAAVVREVFEETGLRVRIVRALGIERYDVWPSKPEMHQRHFFQLAPLDADVEERWSAGEEQPSDGGAPQNWTCWWMPLEQAHVLCAGFGAQLGRIVTESS